MGLFNKLFGAKEKSDSVVTQQPFTGVKENTPQQLDTAKALFEKYFKTVYLN